MGTTLQCVAHLPKATLQFFLGLYYSKQILQFSLQSN